MVGCRCSSTVEHGFRKAGVVGPSPTIGCHLYFLEDNCMKYRLYKYQRRLLQGFILATILSIVNSILVIEFELYGGANHGFAILFPIIVFPIVYFSFGIYIYNRACLLPQNKWLGVDSKYVEQNYPDIWCKAPPWGRWWLTISAFIRGRYDDNKDERLNRIKYEIKITDNILGGGFLLIVLVEFFNLILF